MLTSSEFHKINYESIIADAQSRDCTWYYFKFEKQRKLVQESEDQDHLEALVLFQMITSFGFNLQDKKNPLDHMTPWTDENGDRTGTGHPSQLSPEQLIYLSEVFEQINDVELKARIADILWIRRHKKEIKRPIDWAHLAVESYLQSAQLLLVPENWYESKQRCERAIQIALQLKGAGEEHIKNIVESIEGFLSSYTTVDKNEVKAMFMALLAEYKLFKIEDLDNINSDAQQAFDQLNFNLAKRIWETVAEIHAEHGNIELKKEALVKAAYCLVETAKLKAKGNEYLAAFVILKDALDSLMKLEIPKEDIEELHVLLLNYEGTWADTAPVVEFRMDGSAFNDLFENIRQQIQGKSFLEALITLSSNFHFLDKDTLSKNVEEQNKKYVFSQIGRSFHTTKSGKVLNELFAEGAEDSEANQHIFQSKLNKQAQFHFQVVGLTIQVGAGCILEEHYVTEDDFLPIVKNNPFVPKGRERIFAKGLYHGLNGEYLLSSHLLIPQIENSFRFLLEGANIPTSKIAIKQPQTEHSFEKTITHPKMREMFPDDLIFTFLSLLSNVDSNGTNLRNELCHGLLEANQFINPFHAYAWGLILRMCCDGFLELISLQEENRTEENVSAQ